VSEHCPACSRIAPLVTEIEERCTNGDGSIVRLDLESNRGRALAEHFGVIALPTFLHLDAEGREVDRVIGALNREQLTSVVEIVHGSDCKPL
jgi:cytochrome c-type biogenesis protein